MDIIGTNGDDTLVGSNDNDRLIGGAGNDTLDGGGPFNAAIYDFTSRNTPVVFTSTLDIAAASSTQLDGLGGTDTLVRIDGEEIYGGSAADQLTGSNGQDFIEGGGGDDVLAGGTGRDSFGFDTAQALGIDTITDLAAGDTIVLHNFVVAGPVTAGDGSTLAGGQVQVAYDQAADTTHLFVGVDDAAGADLTIALTGRFEATGFSRGITFQPTPNSFLTVIAAPPPPPQDQTLQGTPGNDTLTGGTGNDTIGGAAGNDILDGAAGDDEIHGNAGNDKLFGGAGDDHAFGEGGKDRIEGGAGSDTLVGGDGDDMLWGDDGADWIQGDAGNDRLTGGAGDDFLVGGTGDDIYVGNAGADTFWIQSGGGNDRIDFFFASHRDRIRLDADIKGSGIQTAADAFARTTDTADGAVVDLGAGNTVTLTGVHLEAIGAGIFEIA